MNGTGASPADARLTTWDADEAVTQLYAAHFRSLVRLAALLLRDTGAAEEVTQDAFVAMHGAWRGGPRRPRQGAGVPAPLRRQRCALRPAAPQGRREARAAAGSRRGERRARRAARGRARRGDGGLRRLPERQREVLVLRYYLDLSEAGIADALGISRGAVKSHASRGIAALRISLETTA